MDRQKKVCQGGSASITQGQVLSTDLFGRNPNLDQKPEKKSRKKFILIFRQVTRHVKRCGELLRFSLIFGISIFLRFWEDLPLFWEYFPDFPNDFPEIRGISHISGNPHFARILDFSRRRWTPNHQTRFEKNKNERVPGMFQSVVALRRKRGPVTLTRTAWVKFLPSLTHKTCLCFSAISGLMKLAGPFQSVIAKSVTALCEKLTRSKSGKFPRFLGFSA